MSRAINWCQGAFSLGSPILIQYQRWPHADTTGLSPCCVYSQNYYQQNPLLFRDCEILYLILYVCIFSFFLTNDNKQPAGSDAMRIHYLIHCLSVFLSCGKNCSKGVQDKFLLRIHFNVKVPHIRISIGVLPKYIFFWPPQKKSWNYWRKFCLMSCSCFSSSSTSSTLFWGFDFSAPLE